MDRRTVLRGTLNGVALALGVPLLDCMLNFNGTALAAGQPLPVRFGTWFWGLGLDPGWQPTKTGKGFDFTSELKPLEVYRDQMNLFSDFQVITDSSPNVVHVSGWAGIRTGVAPLSSSEVVLAPTLDLLIGDAISQSTRFRSLDLAPTGNSRDTYSARSSATYSLPETSALELYQRVFTTGFVDPNAPDFKPDSQVIARKSVLSGIKEQRIALMNELGQSDKTRMDEYFTSLRQVEQQLDLALQRPPRADACTVPKEPAETTRVDKDIAVVRRNHDAMAQLLAMALACNQTRSFNMVFSQCQSDLHRAGDGSTHHELTHEEPVDPKLGLQPQTSYFVRETVNALASFANTFASIKEGDGTLLDHMMIMAHSDTNYAKVHSIESIPVITLGRGGGRLKTGYHLKGNGDPVSRVGLTLMQAMGVQSSEWGAGSMKTTNLVSEILA
jgi:hypothetical protein